MLCAVACLCAAVCVVVDDGDVLIDWTNPQGEAWTFRARIDRPAPAVDRGRAVFMFGGGFSNDLDWTTPGRLEHDGQSMQLTITGEDARDGSTLAEALRADGWTVIRYSAIREDDPLHAQSRGMAEAMPLAGTLELAEHMWTSLLARAATKPDEVVVLGHSLGAARGVLSTKGEAAGYVFLAGAYLSPTRSSPRGVSAAALEAFGEAGADGAITRGEAAASEAALPGDFEEIDRDRSGALAGWELAAARRLVDGNVREAETLDRDGAIPWPTDLLAIAERPALALWGGLDPNSIHGPLLERLAAQRSVSLTTRYFADLGHNLGPMEGDRTGPIDPVVVESVVEWLNATFPREGDGEAAR